jgi:GTP-binding protein
MIEGYIKDAQKLRAVVVLLDARREPDSRDARLVEWLRQYNIPAIYALTKSDKLNRQEAQQALRTINSQLGIEETPILTSAKNGQGINELWGEIRKQLAKE